MKPLRKNGFTLIELLLVIAVMGLLMAVTVPAFVDIGRGSRVQTAVNQLTGTINLARQMAITKRERVSIVFPDDFSQLYSGLNTNHHKKALRSYAVLSESQGYVTDWKYLPAGVYFVDTFNPANPFANNENLDDVDTRTSIFNQGFMIRTNFPTMNDSARIIPVLTFFPNGNFQRPDIDGWAPSDSPEIYIAEGIGLDSSGGRVIQVVWKANPILKGIKIRPYTGSIQLVDYTQLDE
jgi:prepilin-type N-terminal cleavage/methylation domain-containing protein